MTKKTGRINMRVNEFYEKIIAELMEKEGENKSFVIHAAIAYYAEERLGSERFAELLLDTSRTKKLEKKNK